LGSVGARAKAAPAPSNAAVVEFTAALVAAFVTAMVLATRNDPS
jgi:hypothetical protein